MMNQIDTNSGNQSQSEYRDSEILQEIANIRREFPSQTEQEAIKRKQVFLQNMQIVTAILVSIFGVVTSGISLKVDQLQKDYTRSKEFTEIIKTSLPDLSGNNPIKAKMSLINLYILAKEEKDKYILVNLAVVSGDRGLMETISDLIADEDPKFIDIKNQYIQAAKNKLSEKLEQKALDKTRQQEGQTDTNSGVLEAKILGKLTPEKISGWIFLGIKTDSNQLDKATITNEKIPSKDSTQEIANNVNLREVQPKPKDRLGKIIGVVGDGSKVKIEQIQEYINEYGQTTIWAKIQLLDKGAK